MNKNKELNTNAIKLADLTFALLEGCHQKEERMANRYGLTNAEFRCLRFFNSNEILNNKELANRMSLSPGRLTRIIDGLVTKGYAIRNIAKEDRRNMDVTLSKKGEKLLDELNLAYITIHQEILANIEQNRHNGLIDGMTQLLSALHKWMGKT